MRLTADKGFGLRAAHRCPTEGDLFGEGLGLGAWLDLDVWTDRSRRLERFPDGAPCVVVGSYLHT